MVRETRPKVTIPLLAMVSYSIVYRYGLKKFLADAKSSGFDAMLFPDLPPPEAKPTCDAVRAAGLDTVLLVAPTHQPGAPQTNRRPLLRLRLLPLRSRHHRRTHHPSPKVCPPTSNSSATSPTAPSA